MQSNERSPGAARRDLSSTHLIAPRTFELRDAEWIEEAATRRRPLLSVILPIAFAALTGFVLTAFAITAAAGGLVALRKAAIRLLRR